MKYNINEAFNNWGSPRQNDIMREMMKDLNSFEENYGGVTLHVDHVVDDVKKLEYWVTTITPDNDLIARDMLKKGFANDVPSTSSETPSSFANRHNAIFVSNASGFYTSKLMMNRQIQNGVIIKDQKGESPRWSACTKRDGTLFVANPDYTAQQLIDLDVWNCWSFGIGLLIDGIPVDSKYYDPAIIGNSAWVDKHPRTIIGQKENSKAIVMIHVDGRTIKSEGVNAVSAIELCQSLGLYNACALDGGGSTQGYYNAEQLNHFSDGKERELGDFIYVTMGSASKQKPNAMIELENARGTHASIDERFKKIEVNSKPFYYNLHELGFIEGGFVDNTERLKQLLASIPQGAPAIIETAGGIYLFGQQYSSPTVSSDGNQVFVFPSNIHLLGHKTTFKRNKGHIGANFFQFGSDSIIQGITFAGNKGENQNPTKGLYMTDASNVKLVDVSINDFKGDNLYITGVSKNIEMERLRSLRASGMCVALGKDLVDIKASNMEASGSETTSGLYTEARHVSIIGGKFNDNAVNGIRGKDQSFIKIVGADVMYNGNNGIYSNMPFTKVVGNTVYDNGTAKNPDGSWKYAISAGIVLSYEAGNTGAIKGFLASGNDIYNGTKGNMTYGFSITSQATTPKYDQNISDLPNRIA